MKITLMCRTRLVLCFLFLTVWSVFGDEVNRIPPEIFEKELRPELSDIRVLMDEVDYFSPEKSNHGRIIQENIIYVDESGRSYEVIHFAHKALSNGDLDDVGMDTYFFRPEKEKIYLIAAETILPDGSVCEVPNEGIMIQTPEKERSSMIFTGRKQIRLIYPQVTAGSVMRYVLLIERDSFRIPGEYTDRYTWERNWQTHVKRVVLNLPASYQQKLQVVTYGDGVPEPEMKELENDRTRYEWVREKLPIRSNEKLDGPMMQTGPTLLLSTMQNWDELAAWYTERINESSDVTDEVKAVAQEWAEGAETEDEIIRNLAFRVSKDIRYVSLEFGIGGLQPQPASYVLENGFGDCKDKANFLRVLLQEHGIESYFVLINTDHAGLVEKRCVDYGYFDHAILMIKKSNGEVIFCDPTIKYGSVGLLYPTISDREALVVDHTSSSAKWVKTPKSNAGRVQYEMDLKLANNGELSGWFTAEAEGYYAASLSRRFQDTEREALKQDIEKFIGYFYDSSSVIDYEVVLSDPQEATFKLKAYFIRPDIGQGDRSVSWPDIKWLLPGLGDNQDVKRDAFLWDKEYAVRLKIVLPKGSAASSLPADWSVKAGGFSANASWKSDENILSATWDSTITETIFNPSDFRKLYAAVDATKHWMEKLVLLGSSGEPVVKANEGAGEALLNTEFVLMSTGEGQLTLVDHLYPANTKAEQRKLALEKTKSWFPKDLQTQFECDIRLGWLAYYAKDYEQAIEIVDAGYSEYAGDAEATVCGWALYLKALALEASGRVDESKELYIELESDPDQNEFRKGYAAYQYARLMREENPETAVTYYFKALDYETSDVEWMLQQAYRFLLAHAAPQAVVTFFDELHERKPEKAEGLAQSLIAEGVKNSKQLEGLRQAREIQQILVGLSFAECFNSPEYEQLTLLSDDYRNYEICRKVLQEHLDGCGYSFWIAEPDRARTFDEYEKAISAKISQDAIEEAARLCFWRFFNLDPEIEFPEWVWNSSRMIDYLYRNGQEELEPFRDLLFAQSPLLPVQSEGGIDLMFLKAEAFEREQKDVEALAVYEQLFEQGLEEHWQKSLYTRWASLLNSNGQREKALEVYAAARKRLKDDPEFLPLSVMGVYALLDAGRMDEATQLIQELYATCQILDIDDDFTAVLEGWVELIESETLADFFEFRNEWWPQWSAAAKAIGLPDGDAPCFGITDMEAGGEELAAAIAESDFDEIALILGQFMNAAQWHPLMCREAQSIMKILVNYYEDACVPIYECVIAMNGEQFQGSDDAIYAGRSDVLDSYLNMERYEQLEEDADRYWADTENEAYRSMYSRYGALAVLNLGTVDTVWSERMEQNLTRPEEQKDPYAVNIMSQLYQQDGKLIEARELLETYFAVTDSDNEQMNKRLKGRLNDIQELMGGNAKLTEGVMQWLDQFKPSWTQIFPDPALDKEPVAEVSRKVEKLLDQSNSETTLSESNYLLCAALDERLSSAMREYAFYSFLSKAILPVWDRERMMNMFDAVIQNDSFSNRLRNQCVSFSENMAYMLSSPGYMKEKYIPYTKLLSLEAESDEVTALMTSFCNRDAFSEKQISDWMNSVKETMQPFSGHTAYLLNLAYGDLQRLGAADAMKEQIQSAKEFTFKTDAGSSSFSVQLAWQQELGRLEDMNLIHGVLEQFFMDLLKPDEARPDHAEFLLLPRKSLSEQRAIIRGLLKYGIYDHTSFGFWIDLNDLEYMNGLICIDEDNLGPLLDQLLAVCKTDNQYNLAIDLIARLFDSDNAACLEILSAKTKELTLRTVGEQTKQTLLSMQYRVRIRTGDQAGALQDLKDERNLPKQDRHRSMMVALISARDTDALNVYLNTADTDLLLDDSMISMTLDAYRLCGRDAEYALVKEKGEEVLFENMAEAVLQGERYPIYYASEMAEQLNQEDALTDEWLALVEQVARVDDIYYLQMRISYFRQDWAAMEEAASKLSSLRPTHYDTYFYLGKAKIQQGEYQEGLKALEPFLTYCKDNPLYAEAIQLQNEARSQQG
ncbi:DUF3857 and transglutaminase domain-containing protein [Pontiellaceae bacterium B1224]|nr:DUF3857 and transglutaminase domain-containing protein [Pontiellaceae bacterium B1224]